MSFDLKRYLDDRQAVVELGLRHELAQLGDVPPTLREAMAYSLLAGGKRLRPILTLAACEAVGGAQADALPAACALEMIHTYSLVHDDLPSMDNDDFRRGRPTCHKMFGEAMAILVGDALLADSFRVATRSRAPAQVLVEVIAEIARAAGAEGMVGGQVIDVESTGKKVDLGHLCLLHRKKTGALLLAAVRAGALIGGADADRLARLSRYGEALGLAFQIVDDVLDITQDLETLGKDPGSDRASGKTTFVDLLGIDGARSRAREVMDQGVQALAPLGAAAEPLRALGQFTVSRDR